MTSPTKQKKIELIYDKSRKPILLYTYKKYLQIGIILSAYSTNTNLFVINLFNNYN